MAKERWFANGWEITQGIVRDVESIGGLSQTPPTVGKNAEVAGRRGTLWVPKVFGPGRFVLNVWVGDDSSESERDQLWDDLVRVMCSPHRQVQFRRIMRDGTSRFCYGEVVSQVAAEPVGMFAYRAGFEVHVPAGVWFGWNTLTASGSGETVPLTQFARSTAPLDELAVTIHGPASADVTISDGGAYPSRDSFTYGAAIPGGASLTFNAGTFAITGSGLTPNLQAVRYAAARYLTVSPGLPGVPPTIKVEGGGSITVTGREQFVC